MVMATKMLFQRVYTRNIIKEIANYGGGGGGRPDGTGR